MNEPDCEPADFPCWQHYNEQYACQPPTRWVIDLATDLVSFRLRAFKLVPNDNNSYHLLTASRLHQGLHSQRWRNIVREPFEFAPNESKADTYIEEALPSVGQGLLVALGLAKPPSTITRRI